jgi:hypothetical protein
MVGQQVRCPICSHVFEAAERSSRPPQDQPAPYRPPAPAGEPGPAEYDSPRRRPPTRSQDYDDYPDRDYDDAGPFVGSPRRTGAAVWMLIAGILDTLVLLMFYVFVFTVDPYPPPPQALVFIAMFSLVLYLAPLVFIFISAAIVRTAQSSGLVITGSVMAFILAFEQLIMAAILGIVLMVHMSTRFRHERLAASVPILFVLCVVALIISIIAGVKALIAISRVPRRRPRYY